MREEEAYRRGPMIEDSAATGRPIAAHSNHFTASSLSTETVGKLDGECYKESEGERTRPAYAKSHGIVCI